MSTRIIGLSVVATGVVLNNYALLQGMNAVPEGHIVVLSSNRLALAAAAVMLVVTGLFVLLPWARSVSSHERHA